MAIANTKTCSDCGAINDANDLFCKNCGTSLALVNAANEQTVTFTPMQQPMETQTTAIAPAVSPQPVQPVEHYSFPVTDPQMYSGTMPPQESVRGAVLGWLAATLMLIIVAAFIWSSVISDATRDRFTGWF